MSLTPTQTSRGRPPGGGDLSRSAVIRALLELRSLPNRLQRVLKGRPTESARPPLSLDDMERVGFLLLGERPGHEIVFGSVVQPWKAVTDDVPAPQVEADRFATFDTPGYVKVAFNIRVEPYGSGRSLITTETRTAATDPDEPPPLLSLLVGRGSDQCADPPIDARDREIRCRATIRRPQPTPTRPRAVGPLSNGGTTAHIEGETIIGRFPEVVFDLRC